MTPQEEIKILQTLIKQGECVGGEASVITCDICPLDKGDRDDGIYPCINQTVQEAKEKLLTYTQEDIFEAFL